MTRCLSPSFLPNFVMTEIHEFIESLLTSRQRTISEVDKQVVEADGVVEVERVERTGPEYRRAVDDPAFTSQSP